MIALETEAAELVLHAGEPAVDVDGIVALEADEDQAVALGGGDR